MSGQGQAYGAGSRLRRWGKAYLWVVGTSAIVLGAVYLAGNTDFERFKPKPANSPVAAASEVRSQPTLPRAPVQDAASAYAERIQTYWLPEVHRMPTNPPMDDDMVGKLLARMEGMVTNIADASALNLTARQNAKRTELIEALSAKQKKLLPAMRRRYAEMLDRKLFRRDIRVESVDGGTLRLTGNIFVRNANVEDMQTELAPILARLRFRHAEYRWSSRLATGLKYDLSGPADGEIARWDGTSFTKVQSLAKLSRDRKADPDCVPELAASIGLSC